MISVLWCWLFGHKYREKADSLERPNWFYWFWLPRCPRCGKWLEGSDAVPKIPEPKSVKETAKKDGYVIPRPTK